MGFAAAFSALSLGLGAVSAMSEANAKAAAAGHQAQQAEWAAQGARINANNTDTYYRDNLRQTLANIDAIRASAGVIPDSPTGLAIRDEQTRISNDQRIAKVTSIRSQANQDIADAQFYRTAADTYSGLGILKAADGVAMGLAKGSF